MKHIKNKTTGQMILTDFKYQTKSIQNLHKKIERK